MNRPNLGGFQDVIDQANQMTQGPIASPFGIPKQALAQGPRLPIRQTTQIYNLPRDIAAYDEICNELWAGRYKIRFEDRTFTKEGEVVIILSYFTDAPAPRQQPEAVGGPAGAGEEAAIRPYRIP